LEEDNKFLFIQMSSGRSTLIRISKIDQITVEKDTQIIITWNDSAPLTYFNVDDADTVLKSFASAVQTFGW